MKTIQKFPYNAGAQEFQLAPLDTLEYYYQPHNMVGDWGYDKELKKKFLDDKKKYGFVKAGYLCLYHHEMEVLAEAILTGKDIRSIDILEKHADWAEEFLPKYDNITEENVMDILHDEIGKVFSEVLEDAGVYKRDEVGQKAFMRFVESLK